jgi:hypothetical protein
MDRLAAERAPGEGGRMRKETNHKIQTPRKIQASISKSQYDESPIIGLFDFCILNLPWNLELEIWNLNLTPWPTLLHIRGLPISPKFHLTFFLS